MNQRKAPIQHIALVGFANAGKSTLFNRLTNKHQNTGNWTGVTVAAKQQKTQLNNRDVLVTDLPGLSTLTKGNVGQDVDISQKFIKEQAIDCLVNVVDATQIHRQLYLTTQLLALEIPMVVVINKSDRKESVAIDIETLSTKLGCPVIVTNSLDNKSKEKLAQALNNLPEAPNCLLSHMLPKTIAEVLATSGKNIVDYETQLACKACTCDKSQQENLVLMQSRYELITNILQVAKVEQQSTKTVSDKIDKVLLHPVLGTPIFLLMMYLLFMFAINVGGAFIDFFDILGGYAFVSLPSNWLAGLGLPDWLSTIIEGAGLGIQTVLTFIPIVMSLFIGLSILESSGYLARAAFVVDGVMHKIGLPGKAFVPLIVGFGCTVPAVMSARILDSERERITTVMMAPFMSCGARLPVYALFAAAFFPESGQNLVFLLYLIGIVAAIGTGLLLMKTVLVGKAGLSIMELPLYELPRLSYLVKRVMQRTQSFVSGAGKTIVIVVCILNFFNSLGTDGEFGHQEQASSLLSQSAKVFTPLLSPLGVEEDNWQASVGIITGIFAKEALVATFNALYSVPEEESESLEEFPVVWQEATDTIKENLLGLEPSDPLGTNVGDIETLQVAAQSQEVEVSTLTRMQSAFAGQLGAFSYLLFILLYTPCAAAMGAIKNEVGSRWALFAALWGFALAYLCATFVFQLGSYAQHPLSSSLSMILVVVVFGLIYWWLKKRGAQVLTLPIKVTYS